MRIAVTGAAGRIGSAVARRLHDDGHELVLLDQRRVDDAVAPPAAQIVECDGRDDAALDRAFAGAEVVCHLGEIPNLIAGYTPQEVFDTNTAICRATLAAAARAGVRRLVYTSSCQQYGYWGNDGGFLKRPPPVWPIDETLPAAPQNKYAESKAANEHQCREVAVAGGFEIFIFRFPWVICGPLEASRAARIWSHADAHAFDGGWTHLDLRDAAEAYALAVRDDRPLEPLPGPCEAFHLVADEVIGTLSTREKLRKFFPDWPPLPADWPDRAPPVTSAKAARYLGWRPAYRWADLVAGVEAGIPAEQSGR